MNPTTLTTTVWYTDLKDFKGLSYFINVMVGCGIFTIIQIASNFMRVEHPGDWYLYSPGVLEMWAKRAAIHYKQEAYGEN